MANASPPVIIQGSQLPYTKRPFLGKWVNHIIALYNGITRLRVNVVQTSGSSATTAAAPSFVLTPQGAMLTIPIPPATPTEQQGWFWTAGSRNYDESQTFQEQQAVYVSPTSTAATTGLLDAGTMEIAKAVPGIYVCLKANAPEVISMVTYYRVPQFPMPVPGDMDSDDNYWVLISQDPQCI